MEGYPVKLVRDRIRDLPSVQDGSVQIWAVGHTQHLKMLRKKLSEEVAEYLVDGGVGELADILEVVEALGRVGEGRSFESLRSLQLTKRAERGGFQRGHVMFCYPPDREDPR